MSNSNGKGALINLDLGLGDAAKTLIERVSSGCGTFYEPYAIVKKAKAEAAAKEITLASDLKLEGMQRRAIERLVNEETKKQRNIENITASALQELPEDAKPENIEEDWMNLFLDKAKLISNEDMQKIWAKILAGESSKQGSYSKRALNILFNMSRVEAEVFSTLCSFSWMVGRGDIESLITVFDVNDEIYKNNGITFSRLVNLDSIGLINFDNVSGFVNRVHIKSQFIFEDLNGNKTLLEIPAGQDLPIGKVILSDVGFELFQICTKNYIPGFFEYCKSSWIEQGINIRDV